MVEKTDSTNVEARAKEGDGASSRKCLGEKRISVADDTVSGVFWIASSCKRLGFRMRTGRVAVLVSSELGVLESTDLSEVTGSCYLGTGASWRY